MSTTTTTTTTTTAAASTNAKQSAGVLPIYKGQLVLVTKLHDEKSFIFPKGKIERGETPHEAAQREALEEAGLVGHTDPQPFARVHHICFHKMNVVDMRHEFLEVDKRTRVLMSPQEALDSLNVVDYVKHVIREAQNNKIF